MAPCIALRKVRTFGTSGSNPECFGVRTSTIELRTSSLNVDVLDLVGNLDRFLQHGGNGTILVLGEVDGIFHGFAADLAAYAVNQLDRGVDRRISLGALAVGAYFQAGEWLSLFAQDADDIACCAAAEGNEHKFHGAAGCFLRTGVGDEGMAGRGLSNKAVVVGPE